jgi:hypothetical protein
MVIVNNIIKLILFLIFQNKNIIQNMSDFTIQPLENEHTDLQMNFENTNFQNTLHPILSEVKMKINNIQLDNETIEIFENTNSVFGILEVSVSETKKTTHPIYLKFDIDTSASMSDIVTNVKTKINFVQKTIESMCHFIAEQKELVIYINVSTFDSHYNLIIPTTRITLENRYELIKKINNLEVDGCTNIEKAFLQSSKVIEEYKFENPTHKIVYILLTDGNPTAGNCFPSYLSSIKPDALNKCIGYGIDHNAKLLNSCGEYYFINDYENTGKIYGEILHRLIYPALENIEIRVKNGAIYNSVTNSWDSSIVEKEMYSEQKRTFHIQMNKNEKIEVDISGKVVGNIENEVEDGEGELLITTTNHHLCTLTRTETTDLTKYMFRQKTQEFLFESTQKCQTNSFSEIFKTKLNVFFKKMRSYMRTHNLLEDPFMKLLCDDILVLYKTSGKHYAEMYSISRHQSQTNETPYRVTSTQVDNDFTEHLYSCTNSIQRQHCQTQFYEDEDIETIDVCININEDGDTNDPDDITNYVSNIEEDVYAKDSIINTMRQISGTL